MIATERARPQDAVVNLSRRELLGLGLATTGGLVLGIFVPFRSARGEEPKANSAKLNAFVRIGSDESVLVVVNHSEMGQGTYTSICMTVADELDADWSKVRYEPAPVDPAYNHPAFGMQATGGSTSTAVEWQRLRTMGASARAMLVAAAAASLGVDAKELTTDSGWVIHKGSDKKLSYGQIAEKAAALEPPKEVALKDPKDWKIIGKTTKRLDTPEKTNGKAVFGIDVNLPNMLVAVVARPPVFRGKLKSFDATKAKAVAGVKHVIEIERGVAVVADGYWAAKLGRDALTIEWDEGPLASLDSKTQLDEYLELAKKPGKVARHDGDAAPAIDAAPKKIEAIYDLPYLAHATMEPLNAVADVRADGCEVWTGTQFQTVDHMNAARLSGHPPDKVKLHTTLLGGGFGRRAVFDSHFVAEAVQCSKIVKQPVKVIWSREDDMRGGFYRPRAVHWVRAALDDKGAPVGWEQRIVCQSFMAGTPLEGFVIKDGVDATAVEGAREIAYTIPSIHVEYQRSPDGVPCHFWRSVGHTHTAFVVETFIDELAHNAGKDPVEFRLGLLDKTDRRRAVLQTAAEKAGWGQPLPEGHARGVAVHESFNTFVAQVVEVSLQKDGRPRVHRVVVAVDCGPNVVNPDTVKAQMESGVVFGLSAALRLEISFAKGRVKESNWHDYQPLRMNEMPKVEVHIVPGGERLSGCGEPGVPPIAPAVANALFVLTGTRIHKLPIGALAARKA